MATLPRGVESNAIGAELVALRAAGECYLVVHQRVTGVLVLTAIAAIAALFTDSTPLAQAAIVAMIPAIVYGRWRRDDFDRDWRRMEFLRGYTAGQLGELMQRPLNLK